MCATWRFHTQLMHDWFEQSHTISANTRTHMHCNLQCYRVLQCVAVCCSWLQCTPPAAHLCSHSSTSVNAVQSAVGCRALQCAAVWCRVLQCVAVCRSVSQCVVVCCSVLQCVAVGCSGLQWVAACCSVLQCVAVCCSVYATHDCGVCAVACGGCLVVCKILKSQVVTLWKFSKC